MDRCTFGFHNYTYCNSYLNKSLQHEYLNHTLFLECDKCKALKYKNIPEWKHLELKREQERVIIRP